MSLERTLRKVLKEDSRLCIGPECRHPLNLLYFLPSECATNTTAALHVWASLRVPNGSGTVTVGAVAVLQWAVLHPDWVCPTTTRITPEASGRPRGTPSRLFGMRIAWMIVDTSRCARILWNKGEQRECTLREKKNTANDGHITSTSVLLKK